MPSFSTVQTLQTLWQPSLLPLLDNQQLMPELDYAKLVAANVHVDNNTVLRCPQLLLQDTDSWHNFIQPYASSHTQSWSPSL